MQRRPVISMISFVALAISTRQARTQDTKNSDGFKLLDHPGNIRSRDTFQLIGSYSVLGPKGNAIHDTYASPGTAEAYRRTGKFPDDTVLVKEASLVEVSYPPGGRSAEHRHPGFIVGYALEGQMRFAINREAPRVLRRGEMFYESTDAFHSTSENAEPGMPAKILAFMVAPQGRPVVEGK